MLGTKQYTFKLYPTVKTVEKVSKKLKFTSDAAAFINYKNVKNK